MAPPHQLQVLLDWVWQGPYIYHLLRNFTKARWCSPGGALLSVSRRHQHPNLYLLEGDR